MVDKVAIEVRQRYRQADPEFQRHGLREARSGPAEAWQDRAVRRTAIAAVVVMLVAVVAACADDTDATPVSVASPTGVSSTSEPPGETSTTTVVPELPEIVAAAELGYPRDLLDRGRVNVVVTRDGDEPFVVLDHQLRIDGFEPAVVEERRIVIPGNGQRVALQGIFGEVTDCESPTPLAAALAIHYTLGDDPTVHEGAIELDDTETLADIRARFCTARRVLAENDIALGAPALDGETFTIDVTISRRTGDAELTIHAIQGTVLFGVETPYGQGAAERTLPPGVSALVLPLTFDVNRCDPHAVAETTKKQGLTLWFAIDGATPQPVDVDIAAIVDDLEEILNRCTTRTAK